MNNITLRFQSKVLESKYQLQRQPFLIMMFHIINVGFEILMIMSVISAVRNEELTNTIIFGSGFGVALIAYGICILYRKDWIEKYLVIANHVGMMYQYVISEQSTQETYVFGGDMFALHLAIIIITDTQYSYIQLFGLIIIRITIAEHYGGLHSDTYVFTIIAFILVIIGIYLFNRTNRQLFLSTVKETQWGIDYIQLDILMPVLIKSQFYLFNYDEQKIQFIVKHSQATNDFSNQSQSLNGFLRDHVYQGMTLERYVLSRINDHSQQVIDINLRVFNSITQKYIRIRYSELFITTMNYLIIVNDDQTEQLTYKLQSYEKHTTLFQNLIRVFLQKLLQNSFQAQATKILRCKLMYTLTKFPPRSIKPQSYDLQSRFNLFKDLFNKAFNAQIKVKARLNARYIITCPAVLDAFIINILTGLVRQTQSALILLKDNYQKNLIDVYISIEPFEHFRKFMQHNPLITQFLKKIGPFNHAFIEDGSNNNKYLVLKYQLYTDVQEVTELLPYKN